MPRQQAKTEAAELPVELLNALCPSDSQWQNISAERRDYIDMFGDYIPRGQLHYRRRVGSGALRLSARSMAVVLQAVFEKNDKATAVAQGFRTSRQ